MDIRERPAYESSQVTSMIRGGGLDVEVVPTGEFSTEEMILNIGPQHPSTHGVLRVDLGAGRRGDHEGRAGDRVHAPCRREAGRVSGRAPGARLDEPARLDQRVQQRARLDDRRRATRRHRGARACPVDQDDVRRVEPHPEPPDVQRLLSPGARGDDADLLRVPRARDDPGSDGVRDGGADAPFVLPGRRVEGRPPARLPEALRESARRNAEADRRSSRL